MPLRVTHLGDPGQVAVLNRWADEIEQKLRATNTKIFRVTNTAVAAIPPPVTGGGGTDVDPFIPLPNTALYYMARAIVGQTGLQTIGDSSTSVQNGGAVTINNGVIPSANAGVNVPFTVASGAGAAFNGWFPFNSTSNTNGIFWAGRNNKYQALVGSGVSAASVVIFLGFSTATPSSMRTFPFTGATQYLGIYSPGLGPTDNWHATINGSSVDTGVPLGTGPRVEIIMNDTANTTSFSINGSVPTVISGHNPSGFTWFPTMTFAVNSNTPFNFFVEYMYAQQDF